MTRSHHILHANGIRCPGWSCHANTATGSPRRYYPACVRVSARSPVRTSHSGRAARPARPGRSRWTRFRGPAVPRISGPVPGGVSFLVSEMMGHFGVQCPFEHRLGHLVQQFLRTQRPAIRIRVFHQRVKRLRRQHASERLAGRGTRSPIGCVLGHRWSLSGSPSATRSWSIRGLHGCHDTAAGERQDPSRRRRTGFAE